MCILVKFVCWFVSFTLSFSSQGSERFWFLNLVLSTGSPITPHHCHCHFPLSRKASVLPSGSLSSMKNPCFSNGTWELWGQKFSLHFEHRIVKIKNYSLSKKPYLPKLTGFRPKNGNWLQMKVMHFILQILTASSNPFWNKDGDKLI